MHAARFADARLQRSGRCHESEIRAALKVEVRRFRSPDSLSSSALRDMIRCAQEINLIPDVYRCYSIQKVFWGGGKTNVQPAVAADDVCICSLALALP